MSRPKIEREALQCLRAIKVFFDLANLQPSELDKSYAVAPPHDLSEVVKLARQLAKARGSDWPRLSRDAQERIGDEAVELAFAPRREEYMEDLFQTFCDEFPALHADLTSAKRRSDFEIPTLKVQKNGRDFLNDRDKRIIARRLKAGALRLVNDIFIFAEDDQAAKVQLLGLVRGTRKTLGHIANDPNAVAWLIDSPFRLDAIRRREDRRFIDTKSASPWNSFLNALSGVEPKRIMRCPVCQKLYPALREDQKACSRLCANVNRVREKRGWYERNRDQVKRMGLRPVRGAERRRLVELSNAINSVREKLEQ
jgi:predicted nucleic acid-binding Zn ribbon protein